MRKPISASAVLRQNSPRKFSGNGLLASNMFSSLRDSSQASSTRSQSTFRGRSVSSQKRKHDDDNITTYASVASQNNSSQQVETITVETDSLHMDITKVKSLLEKLQRDLSEASVDPSLIPIFGTLCEIFQTTCKVQEGIVNTISTAPRVIQSTGAVPKKLGRIRPATQVWST